MIHFVIMLTGFPFQNAGRKAIGYISFDVESINPLKQDYLLECEKMTQTAFKYHEYYRTNQDLCAGAKVEGGMRCDEFVFTTRKPCVEKVSRSTGVLKSS